MKLTETLKVIYGSELSQYKNPLKQIRHLPYLLKRDPVTSGDSILIIIFFKKSSIFCR